MNIRAPWLVVLSLAFCGSLANAPSYAQPGKETPDETSSGGKPPLPERNARTQRPFNSSYSGDNLDRIAFPIGGIGAGMFCLEGTGAISHVSLRGRPDLGNEPCVFAALSVKGKQNAARVLEGPVPRWKIRDRPYAWNGLGGASYGLPRFETASFSARFPFAEIALADSEIPLRVEVVGWSPFVPGDSANSSLPMGAIEYRFANPGTKPVEAVFSFHARNFVTPVLPLTLMKNGFVFKEGPAAKDGAQRPGFCAMVDGEKASLTPWFAGEQLGDIWQTVDAAAVPPSVSGEISTDGASMYVPFTVKPGQEKTIRVLFSWYFPGGFAPTAEPWYTHRFANLDAVSAYWQQSYSDLRNKTSSFSDAFYDSTLPPEVVEAVAANLATLKSPTVLRLADGRMWAWEGSGETEGSCGGACTHVWNYAQALPHLFPDLERSLRDTEFFVDQREDGGQSCRASLPVGPQKGKIQIAADGQLGGIMKVYRDWRISGDTAWMKRFWPKVNEGLDYCIRAWDPRETGVLEESHLTTYDVEFLGADSMCTTLYLGALKAAVEMGQAAGVDTGRYAALLKKGQARVESHLFNGDYLEQKIDTPILEKAQEKDLAVLKATGRGTFAKTYLERGVPLYQYGAGCLSDAVLGCWMARLYGLGEILAPGKVDSTLKSIYRNNFKPDLSHFANGGRSGYALGKEGGMVLCTWPRGPKPALPIATWDEVWSGVEYQAASHMIMEGMVDEGLSVVRACRTRYDGTARNPFGEIECGHWYARALASYSLIQALTGVRYDAVDKTLYIDSRLGPNFRSFLSTASGFGTVGLEDGKPFIEMKMGELKPERIVTDGK